VSLNYKIKYKGKGALVQHNKCEKKRNKHEIVPNKCERTVNKCKITINTQVSQEILWTEGCIGTTQNKTKTQSMKILEQYRVTRFYARQNMRMTKYVRVWEYEVQDIKYAVQGYEVMKTLKSLIKDEGDLNQNDVG
jgi:hypothetical protein